MIKEIRTTKKSAVHTLDFNSLPIGDTASKTSAEINGIESIDYVTAQAQLAKTMRRVCENDSPIAIDGIGKDRVVIVPLEHFEKLAQKAGTN